VDNGFVGFTKLGQEHRRPKGFPALDRDPGSP
jgi:hypothetical protein